MTEPAHAPLSPSGADIWGPDGCPGSLAMQAKQPPQEETDENREGVAAHWLLAEILSGRTVGDGAVAPNGVPINEEMHEAVLEIVVDVRSTTARYVDGDLYLIEHRVAAPNFIHPQNWGTPDVVFIQRAEKRVNIWDFKYGHRFVDVYQNWQLVDYAACIIDTYQITDWPDWTFTFTIAQPRCYVRDELGGPLREWFVAGATLAPLFERLRAAAAEAMTPGAVCKTGKHCLDCLAAWDCEAHQRVGGVSVDLIHVQQSAGMDNAAIGLELKVLAEAAKRVKDRIEILEVKALAAIGRGESVPWHKMEFSQTRTVWVKAKQAEAAQLVAMFGVPVQLGIALPTPREVMKQGVDETVIKPYIDKPHGAKKLVRVNENSAAKVFGRR